MNRSLRIAVVLSMLLGGCISPQTEEELAACRQDLTCWSDKYWTTAAPECERLVTESAPGRFRWDLGIRVPMFDSVAWHNEAAGAVLYEGQVIRFKMESGAWQRMRYGCTYDPASGVVALLSIRPAE